MGTVPQISETIEQIELGAEENENDLAAVIKLSSPTDSPGNTDLGKTDLGKTDLDTTDKTDKTGLSLGQDEPVVNYMKSNTYTDDGSEETPNVTSTPGLGEKSIEMIQGSGSAVTDDDKLGQRQEGQLQ